MLTSYCARAPLARYVRLEVRAAISLGKDIVLLHETDARHHAFRFQEDLIGVPPWCASLLTGKESIPWRRRR